MNKLRMAVAAVLAAAPLMVSVTESSGSVEARLKALEEAPVVNPVFGESSAVAPESWGRYEGGKGIVLARSDNAEVDFSVFTYLRNDLQIQKITLNFKGWLFKPRFSLPVLHVDQQHEPGGRTPRSWWLAT